LCQNEDVHADDLERGIHLFNSAEFFEAHEVLENIWRAAPPEHKKFFQGLTQAAVAFHHHSTGNRIGARSVLARARKNLTGFHECFGEIQLGVLLNALDGWLDAMDNNQPVPELPRIRTTV